MDECDSSTPNKDCWQGIFASVTRPFPKPGKGRRVRGHRVWGSWLEITVVHHADCGPWYHNGSMLYSGCGLWCHNSSMLCSGVWSMMSQWQHAMWWVWSRCHNATCYVVGVAQMSHYLLTAHTVPNSNNLGMRLYPYREVSYHLVPAAGARCPAID